MAKKVKEITPKNTKAEILDAYEQLMMELDKKTEAPIIGNAATEKKREKQSVPGVEEIVSEVGQLKVKVGQVLAEISDKMVGKADEVKILDEQIEHNKIELDELFQIKAKAGTLKELIKISEEKQKELTEKEEVFKIESAKIRKDWETQFEDEKKIVTRQWKREEEEYQQERDHKRRQEELSYREKLSDEKKKFELDLQERLAKVTEREKVVGDAEVELSELRKKVDEFDKVLNKAVVDAEEKMKKQVLAEKDMEMKLFKQEVVGDKKMFELNINNLQDQIKRLESENISLKKDLQEAVRQVNQVAVKVIEGPVGIRRDELVRKEEKEEK